MAWQEEEEEEEEDGARAAVLLPTHCSSFPIMHPLNSCRLRLSEEVVH